MQYHLLAIVAFPSPFYLIVPLDVVGAARELWPGGDATAFNTGNRLLEPTRLGRRSGYQLYAPARPPA